MNKLARLGKLLGVLPGTSQDAVMDKASDRIEDLQYANSKAHVAVAKLAKALGVVRPYSTAEVLDAALEKIKSVDLATSKKDVHLARLRETLQLGEEVSDHAIYQTAYLTIRTHKHAAKGRTWNGDEPLFVGAIVDGGTIAAISCRPDIVDVCIQGPMGHLHTTSRGKVKPVQDEADKAAGVWLDAADPSESLGLAKALRFLEDQGLIAFRDPGAAPIASIADRIYAGATPAVPSGMMTEKAGGGTYSEYMAQGWTDSQLREQGFML